MKSQTSLIASQCRLQQWAKQIHDCQNRPADMQVSEWCEMNGITTANYYYRLRRVRCQTAHCGRRKPHFDFGRNTSPIVPYRHLPQTLRGLTADCRSLV